MFFLYYYNVLYYGIIKKWDVSFVLTHPIISYL